MKAWEEMTNAERAAQTVRDIKKRQERRKAVKKRAEFEAYKFTVESSMKCVARVRSSRNRGCRSCR